VSDRLTVRPARPDEFDRVGRLTLQSYVADGLIDPADSYAGHLADAAHRAAAAELLVAVDPGGTLLGTVTVCTPGSPLGEVSRPGELEFRMLAVAPEARGRGVGAVLVTEVLQRAADARAHRVVLCTSAQMTAARRLYARLGFVRLPERDWEPMPGYRLLAFGTSAETAASAAARPATSPAARGGAEG
jgi:ribosomal protein S18 acetylase RimI-like enzyme